MIYTTKRLSITASLNYVPIGTKTRVAGNQIVNAGSISMGCRFATNSFTIGNFIIDL